MEAYPVQTIETVICLLGFILIKFLAKYIINLTVKKSGFKAKEREIVRLLNLIIFVVFAIVITAIWGVKQGEILLFATSIITVLGVALFAEMSILSNVTACLVLFFQHPIKIGDTIKMINPESTIEGELIDITYFFVFIKTADQGIVTIPNSLLLKSAFSIIDKHQRL